jgi:hypothetical protein
MRPVTTSGCLPRLVRGKQPGNAAFPHQDQDLADGLRRFRHKRTSKGSNSLTIPAQGMDVATFLVQS